jgi:UDP-N-acetyl-D-mannosaminuronic acid dehydrogenase
MRDASKILIDTKSTLKKALKKLDETSKKILICINKKKKFQGVITDGDIRRKIINKLITLNSPIDKIINKKAITINESAKMSDVLSLLSSRVIILPVLNSFQKVVGYYSLEDLMKNYDKKISIFGLGYVGLTLALCMSKNGFEINGFDKDKKLIANLRKGKLHFFENRLDFLLRNEINKINFSNKIKDCISDCYIVTVGTPIKNFKPDLSYLKNSIQKICSILKQGDLIILRSTLPIETTDQIIIPLIYKLKKFKPGIDYFISFAPERTIEGNAINELENNPQIIGANDLLSYEKTFKIFNKITKSVVKVENIKSAEFSKLIDNSYRDHKFSFSNQFIEPCERLKIDLTSVIKAVNFGYGRNDIAKPSPGVGGPCLSKDPYILFESLKVKKKFSLIKKVREINEGIPDYIYKKILKLLKKINLNLSNTNFFFLGMAFKGAPETSDLRDSTSLKIIKKFSNNQNIFCYDPVVQRSEIKKLGYKYATVVDGFKKANIIVFLNNHIEFENLDIETLLNTTKKPCVILDTWNILDAKKIKQIKSVVYSGLGND